MVTASGDRPYISLDTNVLALLAGQSPAGAAYRLMVSEYRAAVTYFVQAEIRVRD